MKIIARLVASVLVSGLRKTGRSDCQSQKREYATERRKVAVLIYRVRGSRDTRKDVVDSHYYKFQTGGVSYRPDYRS